MGVKLRQLQGRYVLWYTAVVERHIFECTSNMAAKVKNRIAGLCNAFFRTRFIKNLFLFKIFDIIQASALQACMKSHAHLSWRGRYSSIRNQIEDYLVSVR